MCWLAGFASGEAITAACVVLAPRRPVQLKKIEIEIEARRVRGRGAAHEPLAHESSPSSRTR